ncbi:hypothetical protein SAMN05518871_1105 [Psychrobacillus sp. OK028]|uniref:hypothetical protein n=1 Tax=Psychrobacillus sp. OK028 TaxID=1884359 RepID=UPI00089173F4|nr:hypothetical protein [Psychrobacillus sp. OK028]SDO07936.1 hypothetical protein SAMN05518871_1105 [Psychrobacillus sp. OK028]
MDLLQISRSQLISEVCESEKMLKRLNNVPLDSRSYFSSSLLPYLSMICDGIESLFPYEDTVALSSEFEDINGMSFTTLIKKIRASSKLLTDKKNIQTSIKMLDSEMTKFHDELIKDYNMWQLAYVKILGQEDLGVFYYKNKPFANSSQINLYIKPFNSSVMGVGEGLYKFGCQSARYISRFCSELADGVPQLKKEAYITTLDCNDFTHRDYVYSQKKHRNIFNNAIDRGVALYLLNMQCQLNFALMILDLLIEEHPLKYRIQLLIYYYSVQAIDFAFNSGYLAKLEEHQETITTVIQTHKKIFKQNTLRNNLFHYKLSEEVNPSFGESYFQSMVETHTAKSLEDLLTTVYEEMDIVEKLIQEIIY